MSFSIDRDPKKEPSLAEMSKTALSILSKAGKKEKKGFFLMIEGSRIDMAAHT
jgi:alkaline phosphatase